MDIIVVPILWNCEDKLYNISKTFKIVIISHKYVQWLAIALIVFSKIIETKPCQRGKRVLGS